MTVVAHSLARLAVGAAAIGLVAVAGHSARAQSDDALSASDGLVRPRLVATVSADVVVLGDPIALQLDIEHATAVPVEIPANVELGDGLAERARSVRIERRGERTVTSVRLELVALSVGDVAVPPVPVRYTTASGVEVVKTRALPLRVTGVVGDSDQLRPIAPPIAVDYRDWTAVYVGGGVLALLVFAAAARRVARLVGRRRRRRAAVARSESRPSRPAAGEEALSRLAVLEASGALDADDRKPAFLRLSEIMRDFAGRRFDFPGLELSTDEIRRTLRTCGGDEISERLGDWLENGDMVKFAGYDASPDEARGALYDARRMVQELSAGIGPARGKPMDPRDG